MKLYTEERYLLRLLLIDKKFNLYDVYKETNFSSGQIARFISTYRRKFFIVKAQSNIYLTPIGRYFLKRMNLYAEKGDMYWKSIPDSMRSNTTCSINEPPQKIKINRKEANKFISR